MINIADLISFLTIKKGLSVNSIKQVKIRTNIVNEWTTKNNLTLSNKTLEQFLLEKNNRD